MQADNPDGWAQQDFIDPPTLVEIIEDDPWAISSPSERTPPPSSIPLLDPSAISIQLPLKPIEPSVQAKPQQPPPPDTLRAPALADILTGQPTSASDETSDDELDFPSEWFESEPNLEPETEPPEDPTPTMEFDPYLSDDLYTRVEFIDLSDVDIRLDLFLSGIGLSEDQDRRVRAYLKGFSTARLSNWLPWLNSKSWTGRTLLLFIRFHDHWEKTPEWWESWTFHKFVWRLRSSAMSNILSRDNAYRIVHRRIHLAPDEMIDPLWFHEWDYHSLWRHGFWAFATFAHFRAALNDGEEWESLIGWHSPDEYIESDLWPHRAADRISRSTNGRIPVREDNIPLHSYANSSQHWYAIQDWYQEHDWHDNLGWGLRSIELTESHLPPHGPQGPVWPIGGRNE